MINVTVRTEVNVAADEAYAADYTSNAARQSGVQATTWTSAPPIRVGSTHHQTTEP